MAVGSLAAVRRDSRDLLLLSRANELLVVRFRHETDDSKRGKMLAGVGSLFERDGRFAFDHEPIKIFLEQCRNRLRQGADDARLDLVDLVENTKGAVLKDRIGVQYEQPGFHKCALKGKK